MVLLGNNCYNSSLNFPSNNGSQTKTLVSILSFWEYYSALRCAPAPTIPGDFSASFITFSKVLRFRSTSFLKRIQLLPTLTLPKFFLYFSARYSPSAIEQTYKLI